MEGQGAQAQRVNSPDKINKPICSYTIIFRDDSDGKYYGKLCDGTVEPIAGSGAGALIFTKFTIKFSDFQPNAGAGGDFKFATLPAGSVVVSAKSKASVQWSGGAIGNVGVNIFGNDFNGQPTAVSIIANTANLSNPVDPRVGSYNLQFSSSKILDHSSPSDLWASLFVAGGVIDDLTQGEIEIWLLLMVAK